MSETSREAEFDALAEEFTARRRRGEAPSIEEYANQYPEYADRIRRLFPMLELMESAGSEPDETRPATSSASPELKQIGDYRLGEIIGRGGMGVVYEAYHIHLGRRVALKVLPIAGMAESYRDRFHREARAAARLHHTNIVPVFDFGEDQGIPFYAMQYIDGVPLNDLVLGLSDGREEHTNSDSEESSASDEAIAIAKSLTLANPRDAESSESLSRRSPYWRQIARIGRQAAQALSYAHSLGVVHRDIKPGNLLIDKEHNVWITDFGLAKATDDQDLTKTGCFVGTLRYIAPEAIRGHADERSDICDLVWFCTSWRRCVRRFRHRIVRSC